MYVSISVLRPVPHAKEERMCTPRTKELEKCRKGKERWDREEEKRRKVKRDRRVERVVREKSILSWSGVASNSSMPSGRRNSLIVRTCPLNYWVVAWVVWIWCNQAIQSISLRREKVEKEKERIRRRAYPDLLSPQYPTRDQESKSWPIWSLASIWKLKASEVPWMISQGFTWTVVPLSNWW